MEILNTDKLNKQIIDNLDKSQINNKLLILSMNPNNEEISYKKFIIKKCQQFGIDFVDKEFDSNADPDDIINFANGFDLSLIHI